MKQLIFALALLLAVRGFSQTSYQRTPYTTNTTAAADAHVISIAGGGSNPNVLTNGYTGNLFTTNLTVNGAGTNNGTLQVNGAASATSFIGPLTGNASTATTASSLSGTITASQVTGAITASNLSGTITSNQISGGVNSSQIVGVIPYGTLPQYANTNGSATPVTNLTAFVAQGTAQFIGNAFGLTNIPAASVVGTSTNNSTATNVLSAPALAGLIPIASLPANIGATNGLTPTNYNGTIWQGTLIATNITVVGNGTNTISELVAGGLWANATNVNALGVNGNSSFQGTTTNIGTVVLAYAGANNQVTYWVPTASGSSAFDQGNGSVIAWRSGNGGGNNLLSPDTGLSVSGAGNIAVGTGASGSTAGSMTMRSITCPTNASQWYLVTTSTTQTITNSANNGKAWEVIKVTTTMSATGIGGISVQCPGLETNFYYFPSGLTGTMTNTVRVPIQPGYTNTWVDAPLGTGASDAANLITIEQ